VDQQTLGQSQWIDDSLAFEERGCYIPVAKAYSHFRPNIQIRSTLNPQETMMTHVLVTPRTAITSSNAESRPDAVIA
jgi:hypothetical protein